MTILAVASVARLLTIWFVIVRFPHMWLYSRGIELGTLAQSILEGRGLSSPFGGSTGPTALLSPGYPVVVALVFHIFGSFTFAAAIALMVMQLLFSLITVLLIMHVAERNFGVRTANLAGGIWAVSLPLVWMPTIFWETCLSTLLLLGMIALALRCERKSSPFLWILIGFYSGLAALVNPALSLALLASMGWAAYQTRLRSLYAPFLSLVVFLVTFAPWPLRNAVVLHAFIPFRSTIGFELWVGNREGATGFLDESVFPIFNTQEFGEYVLRGEVGYMHEKSNLAAVHIYSHPFEFFRLSMVRFFRFWAGTGNQASSATFALHALLTTLLGFAGIYHLVRSGRVGLAVLFFLPLALFPLPYYITHAEFRYRLVIDPLLTILAAHTVSEWILPLAKFNRKKF